MEEDDAELRNAAAEALIKIEQWYCCKEIALRLTARSASVNHLALAALEKIPDWERFEEVLDIVPTLVSSLSRAHTGDRTTVIRALSNINHPSGLPWPSRPSSASMRETRRHSSSTLSAVNRIRVARSGCRTRFKICRRSLNMIASSATCTRASNVTLVISILTTTTAAAATASVMSIVRAVHNGSLDRSWRDAESICPEDPKVNRASIRLSPIMASTALSRMTLR